MEAVQDQALLFIASIRAALKNGCKHYDESGKLLTTEKQILEAMMKGAVLLNDRDSVQVTTVHAEFAALKRRCLESG